jgi:3-oxoacyl-[acyl-carrier protein] reductase
LPAPASPRMTGTPASPLRTLSKSRSSICRSLVRPRNARAPDRHSALAYDQGCGQGIPLMRRPAVAAQSDGLITHYHNDLTCTERVGIVTGGSRGVGREVVRKLANQGYAVVVGYIRDQGAADSIVDEVLAAGGTALTIRADVADELDVERMFAETTEAFGGIDILVHAAGHVILGPVTDHDLDRFDALQRTNVRGTFLVNRQAARQLRDGGTIVNLAGSAVCLALPTDTASAASSAAVEAMTRVLACELRGRHITVNAVASGLENPGDPAAIADIAAFLVSGDGRRLNGQVIHVDGGTE